MSSAPSTESVSELQRGLSKSIMELPLMGKILTRGISAFCPPFDKAALKSMEPLQSSGISPIILSDRWATDWLAQPLGVEVALAVSVFSGAVDKPKMPPEESNWDGNWVKCVVVEGTVYVGLEKLSLGARGGGERDDRELFSNIWSAVRWKRDYNCAVQFQRANTEPVSTGPRDRVSAVKQEAFYSY